MNDDDLKLPTFLDRKLTPLTPATDSERAAFIAKAVPTAEQHAQLPDPIIQQLDDDAARKKAIKTANRIARMVAKKAVSDIPEKFRAWDIDRSRYYDTRIGKKPKEKAMTATAKKANGDKRVVSFLKEKTARKKKAAAKGAAPAKKQTPKTAKAPKPKGASKRDKLIAMLKRDNGASLGEMLKANPLSGKTPLATLSAMVSVLKRDYKIEGVGDGKGEHRRYRIV